MGWVGRMSDIVGTGALSTHLIMMGRWMYERWWRGSGIRLLVPRLRWWESCLRGVGVLWRLRWWKRLTMGTVEHQALGRIAPTGTSSGLPLTVTQMRIGRMSGHEGLRLGRDWREHALLVETDAIAAASVLGSVESGASDLEGKEKQISLVLSANFLYIFL